MSTPPFDTAYLINLFSSVLGPSGELTLLNNNVYANQILASIQGTSYISNVQIVLTLTAMENIPMNTTLSMYAINNIPLNDIISIMDVLEGVYAGTITMIDTNYPANSYLVWYSYAMNQVGCAYPTTNCYMNNGPSNLTNFLGYSNMASTSVPSYSLMSPSIAYNSIPVTPYNSNTYTSSAPVYGPSKNGFIGFLNNIGGRRRR
jgi:hypothetical protein